MNECTLLLETLMGSKVFLEVSNINS